MGYSCYERNGRFCGYGIPAYCEYPGCNKEIDRGLSYACGGDPDICCGRYFCPKHLDVGTFDEDENIVIEKDYDREKEDTYSFKEICKRCSTGKNLTLKNMNILHGFIIYYTMKVGRFGETKIKKKYLSGKKFMMSMGR